MSIIDGNKRGTPQWRHDMIAARARAIDTVQPKRDLRKMLAEAVKNTAKIPTNEDRA